MLHVPGRNRSTNRSWCLIRERAPLGRSIDYREISDVFQLLQQLLISVQYIVGALSYTAVFSLSHCAPLYGSRLLCDRPSVALCRVPRADTRSVRRTSAVSASAIGEFSARIFSDGLRTVCDRNTGGSSPKIPGDGHCSISPYIIGSILFIRSPKPKKYELHIGLHF